MLVKRDKGNTLSNLSNKFVKKHFNPKEDVTAYELASIMVKMFNPRIHISEDIWNSLAPDCKRHFDDLQ